MASTRSSLRSSSAAEGSGEEKTWTRVLVTGANAGLGFDTCRRLIDEFVQHRPGTQSLHLVITTRSAAKSSATIARLDQHVARTHGLKLAGDDARVRVTSAELDLTSLPAVVAAGRELRASLPSLDAVVCNAGIPGWVGIDWFKTVLLTVTQPIQAMTWPTFMISGLGLRARPQLPAGSGVPEPPLGEVFCANVFGHYVLAHELGPLLAAAVPSPGRLIWVSSIEALAEDMKESDVQALRGDRAYNSSKRLTDVLALNSTLRSCQWSVRSFLSQPTVAAGEAGAGRPLNPQPRQYVCHPGVVATEIFVLHPVLAWAKKMGFYFARLLGSPWHVIHGYKGAVAPVWLALSPQSTLDAIEEREGPGKWGSATDTYGRERVKRTEVEGWGFSGTVEPLNGRREQRRGRKAGARDLTAQDRADFEDLGQKCWAEMESLRQKWEALMQKAGAV